MKKFLALLLALTMLFALASCGDNNNNAETSESPSPSASDTEETESPSPSEDDDTDATAPTPADMSDPIVLGHVADLTGNEASTGLLASAALKMAVDYFNSIGGVNGRGLTIAEQDAQSDSSIAKDAAQALVENDGAAVILGPTQIGHKSAVAPYAAEAQVPAIYYNGTPSGAVTNNEYVIGLGGSTNQMPSVMAAYLYEELGYSTIVTITQDNTGGQNYINPLIEEFEALGGTVLDQKWVPSSADDIGTYITQAAAASPDCIVSWLSGTQAQSLWKEWYQQGVYETIPMQAAVHGGFTDYFIWKALSFGGNPEVVEAVLEQGVYAPITYAYSIDNEMNDTLKEYYATYEWADDAPTAGTTVPVGSNMVGAVFAAVQTVVEAMKTLDDPTDSAALYEALQNVDTETPEGNLVIDSSRLASKDIHIVKVVKLEDGSFNYEVVKTYENVPAEGYGK